MAKSYTTQAIAQALDAKLIGNGNIRITRLAHPADVQNEHDLALAVDDKLLSLLAGGAARAAVISERAEIEPGLIDACIVVGRPRFAVAKLTELFTEAVHVVRGIHPSAVVEDGAQLGENVSIGAFCYVGSGAAIGDNSILHPQVYVGSESAIGRNTLIHSGVRIGARVVIGDRCILHFNASVGSDGFSYVTPQPGSVEEAKAGNGAEVTVTNDELVRIASLGAVVIGDDVEIGASSTIDRGTVASTTIGNGTKIDNQVQIGHNVVIGKNCMICGRVGIAGSTVIGDRVVLGGATGVADHVKIGDDVIAMAMSGIAGNIAARTVVGGQPAMPRDQAMENFLNLNRLKGFIKKVETLTRRMDALERKSKTD